MMTSEVFNSDAFFNHLGGDIELGCEILNVYLVDAQDRVNSLAKAFEANDPILVVKYSHALKGISATIRAEKMAKISETIEIAARNGDLVKSKNCFTGIQTELDKTLDALKECLNELSN